MSTTTRRATTTAAPHRDWRDSAACLGINTDAFYSDLTRDQEYAQRVCRRCIVRATCLSTTLTLEDSKYMAWGVAGGLTDWQRRALRVEALLGHRPHLGQARKLAGPAFAGFMQEWRTWPGEVVAEELRRYGVIAAPVTVRVALWWVGGLGSVLVPPAEGDRRAPWVRVRDECRPIAEQLRSLGVSNQNIAAYLGVSRDAYERAAKAWRSGGTENTEGVKAA
jgi:hypothetical protein